MLCPILPGVGATNSKDTHCDKTIIGDNDQTVTQGVRALKSDRDDQHVSGANEC